MLRQPAQGLTAIQSSHDGPGRAPGAVAPMAFGQLLRSHRTRRGLSLAQLAERVHFNRGHLSRIETGKRPPSVGFAEACDRALGTGDTFTAIASALEAAARQRQGWVRPAQLPVAKRIFVGRRDLMDRLDELRRGHERSLAVPVAVVHGPPGVGKSTLAVHWAHQAVSDGHFADGQLFADLQGIGPGTAAAPVDVLKDLLLAVGVPAERIPAGLGQRAATFRSYLHGRAMLLVLDNAADARQVLPLLPASPGCAVVVTSRTALPGLMCRVDAVSLPVTELCPAESATLIRSAIGEARADAAPDAVDVLAERCGHLPLALALATEHVVSRQHPSARPLAAELESERARLNLAAGDMTLRDAFDASYRTLDEPSARVFRLLGRLPGGRFDAADTAATAGVSKDEAMRLLHRLAGAHLIRHRDERHYHLPGLLRAYAADLSRRLDGEPERAAPCPVDAPRPAPSTRSVSSLVA